jgi:polyphosphate kinase
MNLFTCGEDLTTDVEELFTAFTSGNTENLAFKRLHVSPQGMRSFLYDKIDREIRHARQGLESGITVKVNSLADAPIIEKLYEASCAGVPIRLVVRGICCLVPGVEGVSENIRVVSVIGRYLEHHRIYRFCNDGEDQVYLSSADWMPRNLNRRIETCFPIDAKPLKERYFASWIPPCRTTPTPGNCTRTGHGPACPAATARRWTSRSTARGKRRCTSRSQEGTQEVPS